VILRDWREDGGRQHYLIETEINSNWSYGTIGAREPSLSARVPCRSSGLRLPNGRSHPTLRLVRRGVASPRAAQLPHTICGEPVASLEIAGQHRRSSINAQNGGHCYLRRLRISGTQKNAPDLQHSALQPQYGPNMASMGIIPCPSQSVFCCQWTLDRIFAWWGLSQPTWER